VGRPIYPDDVVRLRDKRGHDEADASRLCDEILTGPSAWWATRLRNTPAAHTAGVVEQLLERMRGTLESKPADARRITAMAVDVANELNPRAYAKDYVLKLRGQAARDHAFVLIFLGLAAAAIESARRARTMFQVVAAAHDLARLDLVEAKICERVERPHDAFRLVRRAAVAFHHLGDHPRFLTARIHEGALLYTTGDVRKALDVWRSIEDDPELDDISRVRVIHNVALCRNALGEAAVAAATFQRCASEFEVLGMETERTRSRCNGAQALIAAGRNREAIATLRQAREEFERLGMIADAAIAALDLAEQLLIVEEPAEVAEICRDLVTRFTEAKMPNRAITALAFLREAVALGWATPNIVKNVASYLRQVSSEPSRDWASMQ
jgi:tetratricopeptide (TPR) repeat protein